MIKNSFKGLLISSTVLLAFIGSEALHAEKVHATPSVEENNMDKELNEEALNMLLEDIELTQEKVNKLLEEQETKLQEKQKLSGEMSNLKLLVDNKQGNIDKLEKETETLTKELKKVEADLAKTVYDLKKSEETLLNVETEIKARKEVLSNRLRAVQIKGQSQPSVVDVLFASQNLGDALNSIINLSTIKEAENDLLESLSVMEEEQLSITKDIETMKKEIEAEKGLLDGQHEELKKKKAVVVKEKESLLEKEKEFETVYEANEELLADTTDSIEQQKELIDTLNSNIETVQNNLDAIQDAEQIAELNRIQTQLRTYASEQPTYSSFSVVDDEKVFNGSQSKSVNVSQSKVNTYSDADMDSLSKVIAEAENYLGVPYVWGGATPNGFDCSGFVQYVFKQALGVNLPRVTTQQDDLGVEVPLEDIQAGDLVFWGEPSYHVAIYTGNGYYIHAPSTGDVVKYANRPLTNASHIRRVL